MALVELAQGWVEAHERRMQWCESGRVEKKPDRPNLAGEARGWKTAPAAKATRTADLLIRETAKAEGCPNGRQETSVAEYGTRLVQQWARVAGNSGG